MIKLKNTFFVPLLTFLLVVVGCQTPISKSGPTYQVKRTTQAITISGTNADEGWNNANALENFSFPWLEYESPFTSFRALLGEEALYFQFQVEDEDVVLGEGENAEQAALGSDRVELFFTSNDSLRPYYSLEMDPKEQVFDSKGELYRQIDGDWDWPGLEVAAQITDKGYILEGKIPAHTLDELQLWQDKAKTRLRVGVFRAEFSYEADSTVQHHWISWVMPDSPTPDFHIPSAFGTWVVE